ncbi:hypothetical protein D3C85_1531260 [compost metagenome]
MASTFNVATQLINPLLMISYDDFIFWPVNRHLIVILYTIFNYLTDHPWSRWARRVNKGDMIINTHFLIENVAE